MRNFGLVGSLTCGCFVFVFLLQLRICKVRRGAPGGSDAVCGRDLEGRVLCQHDPHPPVPPQCGDPSTGPCFPLIASCTSISRAPRFLNNDPKSFAALCEIIPCPKPARLLSVCEALFMTVPYHGVVPLVSAGGGLTSPMFRKGFRCTERSGYKFETRCQLQVLTGRVFQRHTCFISLFTLSRLFE